VAAGPDDRDRTSLPAPGLCYEQVIEELEVAGLRAAWSADLGFAPCEPEISGPAEAAARVLMAAAGLQEVEVDIRLTDPVRVWLASGAVDIWMEVEPGMYPERADEFDRTVRFDLDHSHQRTAPQVGRTLKRRAQLAREVAAIFDRVDVLLTPTTAVPPFPAEGRMPKVINGVEVATLAMAVPFTMLANLCWNPATSVPAGTTSDGLPVGLQIMTRRHRDDVALRLARLFEQARPWPRLAPGWA